MKGYVRMWKIADVLVLQGIKYLIQRIEIVLIVPGVLNLFMCGNIIFPHIFTDR